MKKGRELIRRMSLSFFVALFPLLAAAQDGYWNLRKYVIGPVPTLEVHVHSVDTATGQVEVWASESATPSPTFTFDWGDGNTDTGGCMQSHTYQDLSRNYVVTITSRYTDGKTDDAQGVIYFVPPELEEIPLPPELAVTIPDHPVALVSRIPAISLPSTSLTAFDDGFFPVVPRETVEYVLTAGAEVEEDFVNSDHVLVDGGFRQVILRDAPAGGAQALWYADPVAVAAGDQILQPSVNWSVLYHEMAHDIQLNSPAEPCFGAFVVDGRGGYYLWEALARMIQCAVAFELLNDGGRHGLGREIPVDIGRTTDKMAKEIRSHYEDYLRLGMPFCSYENPSTSERETYDTFCTLATRFLVHAEEQDLGYRVPTKRLMKLVHTFDQESFDRWDAKRDTPEADEYRSTFMVTALSYAFNGDLRDEFRALNFPVSDADYEALWQKADTDPADFSLSVTPATLLVPRGRSVTCAIGTEALEGLTHEISFRARLATPIEGASLSLSDRSVEPGGTATITVTAEPDVPLSTSSIRLQSEGEYTAHAADIPVTVVTVPVINSATYAKKTLTIQGSDFGSAPKVFVNGADHSAQITSATDTSVSLKGKKKKLGLHAGENRIVLVDSAGTSSGECVLNL
jgi:hypothetical protein